MVFRPVGGHVLHFENLSGEGRTAFTVDTVDRLRRATVWGQWRPVRPTLPASVGRNEVILWFLPWDATPEDVLRDAALTRPDIRRRTVILGFSGDNGDARTVLDGTDIAALFRASMLTRWITCENRGPTLLGQGGHGFLGCRDLHDPALFDMQDLPGERSSDWPYRLFDSYDDPTLPALLRKLAAQLLRPS